MFQPISLLTSEQSSPEKMIQAQSRGDDNVVCLTSDELDDSQGYLYQAFRAKWMEDNLEGTTDELKAQANKVHSSSKNQVSSLKTGGRAVKESLKKPAPPKKTIYRMPRVKWQSFPEVIMMLDSSVIQKYPELIKRVKAFYVDSTVREDGGSRAPQLTTVTSLGHGAVGWRRRPWFMGPPNVTDVNIADPFEEYPEDCHFRLFFRHVDELAEELQDFQKIEQVLRRLHDAQYLTFLVVTGIKQAIDEQRKKIDKQFKSVIGGKERSHSDLTSEMTFWEDWPCKFYRLCVKNNIHLMTRLNPLDAEKDCPSALLAELSKGIAWQPYYTDTNAGLSFASGTIKRKAADSKEEVWKRWLLELPRMSTPSVDAIAKRWSSYSEFVHHFKGYQIERAIAEVSKERLNDTRTIGPSLATRICTHFLQ